MKHLGDITKINGAEIPPVDVITGGSPCQDLSIAGKRAGLAGERSGLYMEQIRIIKEMRSADELRGRTGQFIRPRYMVWENVPGAFSSGQPKGADFAAVVEEAIRVVEPEAPPVLVPKKGWPTSGCFYDEMGRWSVTWRVHDAKFWGVPQRRRRIALVADFGGLSAPEILFVRKGLSWDSEPSKAEGERTSARVGESLDRAVTLRIRGGCEGGGKGPLTQVEMAGTLRCNNDQTLFCLNDQGGSQMQISEDISGTLRAQEHGHQPIVLESNQDHATIRTDGVSPTLTESMGLGGGYVPMICGGFKHKTGAKAAGIGFEIELAPTLSAEQTSAVLQMFENHSQDSRVRGPLEQAPTVSQKWGTGGNNTPLIMTRKSFSEYKPDDCASTCRATDGKNIGDIVAYGVDCRNGKESKELNGTIQAGGFGGGFAVNNNQIIREKGVRRLTPLECERLQGFPDGWTDIPGASDSARYRALGNSIALPFWEWLCKRISAMYERSATLGSLFDGIGGFPLCWEQINGKGTAIWASEIEKFPIAVTKYHFGED